MTGFAPPVRTIMHSIADVALAAPARTAIVEPASSRALTYGDLLRASRALASRLDAAGDRVLVACPPSAELVVAVLGVWQAGAAAVVVNPLATDAELAPFREVTHPAELHEIDIPSLLAQETPAPARGIDPDAVAVVLGTSGTSGRPKLVPLTHANLAASAMQVQEVMPLTAADRVATALPAFHIAGLNLGILQPLAAGALLVLMERFRPEEFLTAATAYRATRANLVPRMVDLLLAAGGPADALAGMTISCGGSRLRDAAARRFREVFGVALRTGYGLTETSSLTHHTDPATAPDGGCVGRPLPGGAQRIVALGTDADTTPGEVGEVWLKGPQISRGYLGAAPFTDGWLRTGDLGRVDATGTLWIVGRQNELIDYNSHLISPAELESVLLEHPDVLDAVVVGWPDESAGEIPIGVVTGGTALPVDALLTHVRERVSPHKRLHGIAVLDEIPRTASGKPIRRLVLERLAAGGWERDRGPTRPPAAPSR